MRAAHEPGAPARDGPELEAVRRLVEQRGSSAAAADRSAWVMPPTAPAAADHAAISQPVKLLVTGAGGMLGRDVVAAARRAGHETVACARTDLDVADAGAVAVRIADERPDAVVNCAAYTDVDGAESERELAFRVNGEGAANVAAAAAAAGARVIQLSTDYVFDGRAGRPYVESDATSPLSAYGASKLAGEQAVAAAAPERHLIVRSSWLFGVGGRNFVETMLRLAGERDELAVVDDQIGCPTYTGHLAEAIVTLAAGQETGIRHVAGAGHCSWHDFAAEIFRRTDTHVALRRATTAEIARPAARPAFSALASEREPALELPDWREGLGAYLAERAVAAAAGAARSPGVPA